MTTQIAPSILSCDLSRVGEVVREMEDAGADWIHFDVMDGQFVPPITFGDALVSSLRTHVSIPFETHLMTQTPERHFEAFANAGSQRIIFHAEAVQHAHRHVQQLRDLGVRAGIAINPGTAVEAVEPLLRDVDVVLVMTVNPGWGGQHLIRSCLDKVLALRALAPDLNIEVDGGIDRHTISEARAAGANVFVVGSYVTGGDTIRARIESLREACASKS